jgi:hypothetical protein
MNSQSTSFGSGANSMNNLCPSHASVSSGRFGSLPSFKKLLIFLFSYYKFNVTLSNCVNGLASRTAAFIASV